MEDDKTYAKGPDNKIGRHAERASYDAATVHGIVKAARICHVAFVDEEGLPQCVPLIGCVDEESEDGQIYLYFHGYVSARFIRLLSERGTPMTATSTLIDGLVLTLNVSSHSMNYRSAVFHGVSLPFAPDDRASKMRALKMVIDSALPGRWDSARPLSEAEIRGVGVVRMKVESASAKIRNAPPGNDKNDLANDALTSSVWSGVIPLNTVPGEPQPMPISSHMPMPAHVKALAQR